MAKPRALVYGMGNNFIYSARWIFDAVDVIGLVDGDSSKWGQKFFGYTVESLDTSLAHEYDVIVVTPTYAEPLVEALNVKGVALEQIVRMQSLMPEGYRPFDIQSQVDGTGLRVAVLLYGGLGDFIVSKLWVNAVMRQYGLAPEVMHLYVHPKDVATVASVYTDCRGISVEPINLNDVKLIPEGQYDVTFWLNMFPTVMAWDKNAVTQKSSAIDAYVKRLIGFGEEYYQSNLFASSEYYCTMQKINWKKYIQLADVFDEFHFSEEECKCECDLSVDEVLASYGLRERPYITLNAGLNAEYDKKTNMRAWSAANWEALAGMVRDAFPEYDVVQLGIHEDAYDIGGTVNLSGKTSVEQMKVVLKHAALHVDYEGGLVHLRHAVQGGPSVVLFGPTSVEQFGYEENIPIRTNACPQACAWHYKDWFAVCHHEQPGICMQSITPEMVFERVKEQLDKNV